MAHPARWIRLDTRKEAALRAAGAAFALAQPVRAAPAVLWAGVEDERVACALVAPLRLAPGLVQRWAAWALAPLIASYRQFGLHAYLDADAVCVSGGRIAAGEARTVGECALVTACFAPAAQGFMEALRERIEAQHGWQFDHSWPTAGERAAMDEALLGAPAGAL